MKEGPVAREQLVNKVVIPTDLLTRQTIAVHSERLR
jgi:hypothetical protein